MAASTIIALAYPLAFHGESVAAAIAFRNLAASVVIQPLPRFS